MRKNKSACPTAKSKKAKGAKAEGANDGAAKADAKTGVLEGGGINTPFSPANNAGPPTISAIGVDDATALTTMTMAMKGGDEDKDVNAIIVMTTTTTSAIDEYAPLPMRGGRDYDAIVIVDKAPYPYKGEAGTAGAEATGEDREGGGIARANNDDDHSNKGGGQRQGHRCQCHCYNNNDNNRHNQQGPSPHREGGGGVMMSSLLSLMPRTPTRVRLGWRQQKLQGRTGRVVGHQSCQ
jgi:hypothetical protein